MHRLNTSELHRLLDIPDPGRETIFGVVGRMAVLLEIFEKEERFHSLLPFLKTYYFVTKAAAEKYIQRRRFFSNIREYEVLDVYFASLYFKPLSLYLREGKYATPWKAYFDYCSRKDGIPFLQMLLGINAHINGNLYSALVDTHYTHERDFFLVNDILQEVFPEVIHFMVFSEHDIFSAGGLIMKKFFLSEFHTVIERWRSEAWVNAYYTRVTHFRRKKDERHYERLAQKTEQIGLKLIHDFEDLSVLPTLPELLSQLHVPSLAVGQRTKKRQGVSGMISV